MSYEVRFDDGTEDSKDWVFAFGSATDLEGFRQWVGTLPEDQCPRLYELVSTMATKNTMELGAELEVAMEAKAPPDWLRPILDNFAERIGVGDEDETVTIEEGA